MLMSALPPWKAEAAPSGPSITSSIAAGSETMVIRVSHILASALGVEATSQPRSANSVVRERVRL